MEELYNWHRFDMRALNAAVPQFIRGNLDWKTPITNLAAQFRIEDGTAMAFLPREFRLERPLDLRCGLNVAAGDPEGQTAYEAKIGFVQDFLDGSPNRLALFESRMKSDSRLLDSRDTPYFIEPPQPGEAADVCHFLVSPSSFDQIADAIREARPWSAAGFLTSLPTGCSLKAKEVVSEALLAELVRRTIHILVVDAFSDCGMVIWTRPEGELGT